MVITPQAALMQLRETLHVRACLTCPPLHPPGLRTAVWTQGGVPTVVQANIPLLLLWLGLVVILVCHLLEIYRLRGCHLRRTCRAGVVVAVVVGCITQECSIQVCTRVWVCPPCHHQALIRLLSLTLQSLDWKAFRTTSILTAQRNQEWRRSRLLRRRQRRQRRLPQLPMISTGRDRVAAAVCTAPITLRLHRLLACTAKEQVEVTRPHLPST